MMLFTIVKQIHMDKSVEGAWRRWVLPLSAATCALVLCVSLSLVNSWSAEAERAMGRGYANQTVSTDQHGFLRMWAGHDYWEGKQFLVFYIEPEGEGATPLPPGMPYMPEPGKAFVSPALAKELEVSPGLASRFTDHEVLDQNGVVNPEELFAYVRPANASALPLERSYKVLEFNTNSTTPSGTPVILDQPRPLIQRLAFGGIVAIVPALLTLWVGMKSSSGVRSARVRTLKDLGASSRVIFGLNIVESMAIIVPVSVAISLLWFFISPHVSNVPILDRNIFPGDLSFAPGQVVLVIAFVAILSTFVSGIDAIGWRFLGNRLSCIPAKYVAICRWALAFALLAWLFWETSMAPTQQAFVFYLIAVLILLLWLPTIAPSVVHVVGSRLAGSPSLSLSLAGGRLKRRVEKDGAIPITTFATLGAVSILSISAISYFDVKLGYVDITDYPGSAEVLSSVPMKDSVDALNKDLPDALIIPIIDGEVAVASCDQVAIAVYGESEACAATTTPNLSLFSPQVYRGLGDIRLDPEANLNWDTPTHLLVIDPTNTVDGTDKRVRDAMPHALFGVLNVRTPETYRTKTATVTPVLQRSTLLFVALVGFSSLGGMIDSTIGNRRFRGLAKSVGASTSSVGFVESVVMFVMLLSSLVVGMVIGIALSWLFHRWFPFPVPVGSLLEIVGVGVASCLLASAIAGLCTVRLSDAAASMDTESTRVF